ncbi:MAG: TolC family protein, partial [Pirellulaceae bacterium]
EARRAQLETARTAVDAAQRSYELSIQLFREGGIELILPIEVVQSVNALTRARQDYLTAVIEHNRAQFQLLWALGFPLESARDGFQPPAPIGASEPPRN